MTRSARVGKRRTGSVRASSASGSAKRRRALAVVTRASSASRSPRTSASPLGRQGDPAGLVRLAAEGVGAQVGAVGLDQEPVERDAGGDVAERVERLVRERDHPGEREVQAEVEEGLGVVPGAGERVQDAADRAAESAELLDDVALAVAAVDHDGQVALVRPARGGGRTTPAGRRTGCGPSSGRARSRRWRRPGLGRRASTIRSQSPGVGLGGVVGMDADRGEDARGAPGRSRRPRRCRRPSCRSPRPGRRPRLARGRAPRPGRRARPGSCEVGVGVDQGRRSGACRLMRRSVLRRAAVRRRSSRPARGGSRSPGNPCCSSVWHELGIELGDQVGVEGGRQVLDGARSGGSGGDSGGRSGRRTGPSRRRRVSLAARPLATRASRAL